MSLRPTRSNRKKTLLISQQYYLGVIVKSGQGQEDQRKPRQPVASDDDCTQQARELGQEDVEHEGEAVVHGVHVAREAVDDPSHRRDVEEGDGRLRRKGGAVGR